MKFKMDIEKHSSIAAGRIHGHNTRAHPTESQLPRAAWYDPEGRIEVARFRPEQIDAARSLAKRKDAVIAIEIVVQIGNQGDWRDMPTLDHPHGRPRPGMKGLMKDMALAALDAARREFGEENVVGADLHLDESTPHVHIVITPIHEGRLQAKHWLDGKATCAKLRRRIHEVVSARVPCTYTPGNAGHTPHDPTRAAGAANAPRPAAGVVEQVIELVSSAQRVRGLEERVKELEGQLAAAFSREKRAALEFSRQQEQSKNERAALERRIEEAEGRVNAVNREWTARAENWYRREAELKDLYADADAARSTFQRAAQAARTPH